MWGARFASLAAGLTMETVAGSSYAFSIYGPQLKASLNLTQSDIDEVSSVLNVGSYLAFFGGAAYDALGPQWVAFTGAGMWAPASFRHPAGTTCVARPSAGSRLQVPSRLDTHCCGRPPRGA